MSTHLIEAMDLADSLPAAAALRARTYSLLTPGRVVDVGCGTGRAVSELAERGFDPIGVDFDEKMISAAHSRWPSADFRQGNAYNLPLSDNEVVGYRADKLFHHLTSPDLALTEARRVLAPGGRIVLLGQDWDAIIIDSTTPAQTRAAVHARADKIPNPRAARSYRNLLLDHGFTEVTLEAHTTVLTDPAVLPMLTPFTPNPQWIAEQTERARTNRLLIAIPMFLASAHLPPTPDTAVGKDQKLHG